MTRREKVEAIVAAAVIIGLVLWMSYGIAEVLIWASENQ